VGIKLYIDALPKRKSYSPSYMPPEPHVLYPCLQSSKSSIMNRAPPLMQKCNLVKSQKAVIVKSQNPPSRGGQKGKKENPEIQNSIQPSRPERLNAQPKPSGKISHMPFSIFNPCFFNIFLISCTYSSKVPTHGIPFRSQTILIFPPFQNPSGQQTTTLPLCAHSPSSNMLTGLNVFLSKKKAMTLAFSRALSSHSTCVRNVESSGEGLAFGSQWPRRGFRRVMGRVDSSLER